MNIREFRSKRIHEVDILSDAPIVTKDSDTKQILEKISQSPNLVVVTPKDKKTVEGVITPSDVAKIAANAAATADDIKSSDVVTVGIDQTLDDVAKKMKETGHSRIVVVNKNNEFVGVITASMLRQRLASEVQLKY